MTLGAWAAPAWAASGSTGGTGATGGGTGGTAASAGSSTGGSGSTGGSDGSGLSSLQTRAQELAGQIAANGRALDELSASYQAAEISYRRLTAAQAGLRRSMASAEASVAAARQALKEQAILAYLAGGAPIISYLPGRPGLDPSLTISYAEIVAGGQKAAVANYRATLAAEARQKSQLDANTRQSALTLASIRSDEQQASATLTAQQQALSEVKGQMAVEVAKVQAAQQAAEQAQVKATLAAKGQLPPTADAASSDGAGAGASPAGAAPSRPAGTGGTGPAPNRPTATTRPAPPVTTGHPVATAPTAPTTSPTTAPAASGGGGSGGSTAQAPGVNAVLSYARAQIGKPYQWAGAGPDSFDCSGLVMMAWEQAGIYFPHLAQDQYDLTTRIPLSSLIPGDLVFFGSPDNVYHVGIYVGNGNMIDAPETGQNVQVQSIYWDSLLGGGRVTSSS